MVCESWLQNLSESKSILAEMDPTFQLQLRSRNERDWREFSVLFVSTFEQAQTVPQLDCKDADPKRVLFQYVYILLN